MAAAGGAAAVGTRAAMLEEASWSREVFEAWASDVTATGAAGAAGDAAAGAANNGANGAANDATAVVLLTIGPGDTAKLAPIPWLGCKGSVRDAFCDSAERFSVCM